MNETPPITHGTRIPVHRDVMPYVAQVRAGIRTKPASGWLVATRVEGETVFAVFRSQDRQEGEEVSIPLAIVRKVIGETTALLERFRRPASPSESQSPVPNP